MEFAGGMIDLAIIQTLVFGPETIDVGRPPINGNPRQRFRCFPLLRFRLIAKCERERRRRVSLASLMLQ